MKINKLIIAIVAFVILLIILSGLFIVEEGEQAVITQFGKPVRSITEAGLNIRIPFIQRIHVLEKRLLPWDGDAENMQTRDKKRIFVDVWARWRIVDPMVYFQRVRTEIRGYKILDDLVDSAVRDVVARYNLIEVVRSSNRQLQYESNELMNEAFALDPIKVGRAKMENEILSVASKDIKEEYGIELILVKVKRVNYIESVRPTVYDRMRAERLRIANLFESEAKEEENKILGQMQKELEQITGETEQRSAEIRGEADAEVIAIAAEGFSQEPEFYQFLRSLESLKNSLQTNTRLILSTDNPFLEPVKLGPASSPSK